MVFIAGKLCDPCLSTLKWFVYHATLYKCSAFTFNIPTAEREPAALEWKTVYPTSIRNLKKPIKPFPRKHKSTCCHQAGTSCVNLLALGVVCSSNGASHEAMC